jgi:hypothetical protein
MSEPQVQDVVIEPEHPQSPKNLFVDAGLLFLEYFLVKWLLKEFGIWQKNNGPPLRRCIKQSGTPPDPTGDPTYKVGYTEFIAHMIKARKNGFSKLRLHYEATNKQATNYDQLKKWILTCEVNTSDGSLHSMFVWPRSCPAMHHTWDINTGPGNLALGMLCGCIDEDPKGLCEAFIQCYTPGNNESVFYAFWQVNVGVLPKLHAETNHGCPSKCKTNCGTSQAC